MLEGVSLIFVIDIDSDYIYFLNMFSNRDHGHGNVFSKLLVIIKQQRNDLRAVLEELSGFTILELASRASR